jgi:hypothetical protein
LVSPIVSPDIDGFRFFKGLTLVATPNWAAKLRPTAQQGYALTFAATTSPSYHFVRLLRGADTFDYRSKKLGREIEEF